MNRQDIIDTIAKSLYQSHIEGIISFGREAEAALAALHSAGYAVVELPDHPAKALIGGEPEGVYVNCRDEAATNEPGITISGTVSIYADEARPLAAALLAAADAAEADQ